MKALRYGAWILVALLAAYAGFVALGLNSKEDTASIQMGGPFSLLTTEEKVFTDQNMIGRPHLVFFGFTHCPDICPTTLFEASSWLQTLGEDGDKLDVYFISVDPERDTPSFLKNYMTAFDPRITGLTGTLEEVDKATKAFHAFYRKVPIEGGEYTMDHTANVYMMKADGSFMGTIAYQEDAAAVTQKLNRLLGS